MMCKAFIPVFLSAALLCAPAAADESLWGDETKENDVFALPVTLKTHSDVTAAHVVLGDVFSGTDSAQSLKKIANAPACGQEVVLTADWLNTVAHKNGLNWEAKDDDKTVLTRACREITRDDIIKTFIDALKKQPFPNNADIVLNQQNLRFLTPKDVTAAISIDNAAYNPQTATVSGTVVLKENGVTVDKKPLFGKVALFVQAPVTIRPMAKGEIITENDLVIKKITLDDAAPQTPAKLQNLVGKETRRALRAGQSVDENDVRARIAVTKGKTIDVHYVKGGLSLKTQAKALENGAVGDTIRIQNLQTKTTLEGVVINADTVSVTDGKKGEQP